jgi:hypothetical protein
MKRNCSNPFIKAVLIAFLYIIIMGANTSADVSPGDKIDKTNWQKAEGLVPDSVLNYVKKGDFILNIGELKVNPAEYYPLATRNLLKTNVGKYGLSDKDEIVDAKTGKPVFIEGIPFPEIDPADPKAGVKVLYNMHWGRHVSGHLNFDAGFYWISRSGVERWMKGKYLSYLYTGHPEAKDIPNPDGFERQNIITVLEPYDIAGTSVMLWRYLDDRRDNNYSYVPAIRRIRRMSPASRSDAFLGSDFTLDDTASYDGKVPDFEWKLVSTQEALIPDVDEKPQLLVPDPETGGLALIKTAKAARYGFQTEGWQGAPWAPTNSVWVKRKTYIVEGTPKDPYYNYGKCIMWLDADRCAAAYKVNFDRAKAYWKTCVHALDLMATEDGTYKSVEWSGLIMVDDRTDHATVSVQCDPESPYRWQVKTLKPDDFSLGGFQKFCK